MAASSPPSPGLLPVVRVELRHGSASPTTYPVSETGFLVGSVPGCDLRLPGASQPALFCLILPQPGRVVLRRLAPVFPILVNGEAVASVALADGDRVALGAAELLVRISEVPEATAVDAPRPHESAARQEQLREEIERLEADLAALQRRRDEIEQEYQEREEVAERIREQERDLAAARAELERREQTLGQQREEVTRERSQIEAVRRELAELRQQLHERYQARRDRLTGLHEAIRTAARKLQERKHEIDAETQQSLLRKQDELRLRDELDTRAEELEQERRHLESERQELERLRADCESREKLLAEAREALAQSQEQHQADLVLLERQRAAVELREAEVATRTTELDERLEQLRQDGRELKEQALQLDEWQSRLRDEADQLARQKAEHEAASAQLGQRAATLEGQQAMLATLRTRLERMREEVQRESQQLTEQRARLEAAEANLQRRIQETERLRGEIDSDRQLHEQERRHFEERHAVMERAIAQLREVQDRLAGQEEDLKRREQELSATAAEQAEQAALVRARSEQSTEQQQRLTADRQALREREAALTQAEQALASLQEQVRRRSEDLNSRRKAQTEEAQQRDQETARFEERVAALRSEIDARTAELTSRQTEIDACRAGLETRDTELARREEVLTRQVERLKEVGRNLGQKRKALVGKHALSETEQRAAAEAVAQAQAECDLLRQEMAELQRHLPGLELKAEETADRLTQAREQLREHLAEFHAYVRQSRDDLDALQTQVQAEAERVRQQELTLRRARDEHRLTVAAFRQQLIEWQGQVAGMKQSLARDETRLEMRQAEVEVQVREVDATSARLARQAEELQEQERQVASRRDEMTRHLDDMRHWYRRKLRELTGDGDQESGVRSQESEVRSQGEGEEASAGQEGEQPILPLTGEVEPGDRQLGELLRRLDLVDADTLDMLLVEVRKQRRSLRQVLLAGGCLTLYQMALIEAGNLDGLVLGPVRVIDRLWTNMHESAYRVFDPRRGEEALLRHLAETEMESAVRPDEFRQRFAAAAAVSDPHLSAVLEVLEIAGRPAALLEWPTGLPSTDWPPLAAAPGAWHRLLSQAAQGLQAAHQAGLVHGHLSANHVTLTAEGVVKLSGFGEPAWLGQSAVEDAPPAEPAADLLALGRIAAGWAEGVSPRKGKAKALPPSFQVIFQRLTAEDPERRYRGAAELVEHLERAGADLPASTVAWDRLRRQIREQLGKDEPMRESA